jgi:tetraacyldisaccharide 4'-kinase
VWNATEFRKIVSGERRDPVAQLLRAGFHAASWPYGAAVRWRNRGYDRQRREIYRVAVPVISVGNLTVGGTGKTPMVEWLAKWFRQRGVRVCIISRGYGAEAGARNDEALELEQKLPDVPHLQNPDRVAAARLAIDELDTELILLDDAFQHRRIHRDLDIVLLDALEPFGYGHLLPRGLLREPVRSLARADVVALSRADAVDADRRSEIREAAMRHAPHAVWLELAHQPQQLLGVPDISAEIDTLRGLPVAAFCGIGNPAGFRHSLESCGLEVAAFREFPDHHSYDRADIGSLAESARQARALVCTHKDLVKLQTSDIAGVPLWALQIGLSIEKGLASLEEKLQAVLASRGP